MDRQEKLDENLNLGLYLHVPFCASTCDFCAFYQQKPKRQQLVNYLEGIRKEFQLNFPSKKNLQTVFWGGGTPGLLPANDIEYLGKLILNNTLQKPQEWTVEMAPSTVKPDKLKVMKDLGVTRISMGVQSFNPTLLKELGRLHSPSQVYKAYEMIRSAGFDNVNLDLIFAIPNQTLSDWEADLTEAFRLQSEHLSTYCLTFEEDTALFLKLSKGQIKIDVEKEIEFYKRTWELMEKNGYQQYEIANFAQKGYECIHNMNTWKMHEWLGLGPSAASQYKRKRFSNVPSLEKWLEGIEKNTPNIQEEVLLDDATLAVDSLIFGLRMNQGVMINSLQERFPGPHWQHLEKILEELIKENLLYQKINNNIALTPKGRILADRIGLEILSAV